MNTTKLHGTDEYRKWCPLCQVLKERPNFALSRDRYDGYQSRCKECMSLVYLRRKDKHRTVVKRWAKDHPDQMRSYSAKWKERHPQRARQIQADFAKRHPDKFAEKAARRRAVSSKATPKWANRFFISEIYDLAKRRTKVMGYPWHVDHIVPLISTVVCGLHVENNLQVISATQNLIKQNHSWPDMP